MTSIPQDASKVRGHLSLHPLVGGGDSVVLRDVAVMYLLEDGTTAEQNKTVYFLSDFS